MYHKVSNKGPKGCCGELIVYPRVNGVIIVSGVVISCGKKVFTPHEVFSKQNWKPLLVRQNESLNR